MAYSYDEVTNTITLPRGDTVTIPLEIAVEGDMPEAADGTAVVFVVWNTTENVRVLKKSAIITGGKAEIRIASADTREWDTASTYGWSIGTVTDPDIDPETGVYAGNDTDEVVSAFDKLQKFKLTNGGIMGVEVNG